MVSHEVVIADWNKVLDLLRLLEGSIISDQQDKWSLADERASDLDFALRAFFEAYQDIPDSAREQIVVDGARLTSALQNLDRLAQASRKQLSSEVNSFLSQQKGVKAYKKV